MKRLYVPLDLFDSFDDFFFKYALSLLHFLQGSTDELVGRKGARALVEVLGTEVLFLIEWFDCLIV